MKLSRYITGRFLRTKRLSHGEVVRAHASAMTRPPDVKETKRNRGFVSEGSRDQAQDFEKAAALRDSESKERKARGFWPLARGTGRKGSVVTADDMMHIVSKVTGVPLQRMEQKETQKLLAMEAEMKQRVIGQDEAVAAISKALRRSRADLKDPKRPIGSFVFLGPTGVGKTFLARTLAEFMSAIPMP